jgi:transposase
MITREEFQILYDQGPDAVYEFIVALHSAMQAQIDALTTRVEELEARLNKDSHNSSKPPSSDSLAKKPSAPKSLREPTDRSTGGQPGHPGRTLQQVERPDQTHVHSLSVCRVCGHSLANAQVVGQQRRQVFDMPPLRLHVTEHQALLCQCPNCQTLTAGEFPAGVTQPVQYGPSILGLAVYLSEYQLLPLDRTEQLLLDLFGQGPSEGTLVEALARCYQTLAPVEAAIKEAIVQAPVVHFDETGIRVCKRLAWLHGASTRMLTWYAHHIKRGREAFQDLDVLPRFRGRSVHDALASYLWKDYPCSHALCNAHLLRELTGLWETFHQTWTQRLMSLLRYLKRAKERAQAAGRQALDASLLARSIALYHRVLDRGMRQNPVPEQTLSKTGKRKRGRTFMGPSRSLLERLRTHEEAVLGFVTDFQVPFDNNLAERDLRMTKVRMKVSGCFRSTAGADYFCRIRGYISTLRKQGRDLLTGLRSTMAGEPIYPCLQPE